MNITIDTKRKKRYERVIIEMNNKTKVKGVAHNTITRILKRGWGLDSHIKAMDAFCDKVENK